MLSFFSLSTNLRPGSELGAVLLQEIDGERERSSVQVSCQDTH